MKAINGYLPAMAPKQKRLSDKDLLRCINDNIPSKWLKDFKLQKRHKGTIKEAISVLATIEDSAEQEAKFLDQKRQGRNKKNHRTKNDNNNDKNQEGDSKYKIPCRLPEHDHNWYDCPNNPKSRNFNGRRTTNQRNKESNNT